MMKVAFLANIPSPYRVDFFNELGKDCELTVFFEKSMSDERDSSWNEYHFVNFRGIILSGPKIRTDMAFSLGITKYLKKGVYDHIIVCNAFTPTGMYAIQYMKRHRIPYWVEGDGAFPVQCNRLKKAFKSYFIRSAAGCFSTSAMHDQYYMLYGVPENKLYRYPFTSVLEKHILSEPVSAEQKSRIRKKLGIGEEKMILSVGQFIHRKGFDVLLRAMNGMDRSIGVYIVGGTATDEMEQYAKEHGLGNVHCLEFMRRDALREYYQAADLFVLPTREDIWGLVVNEAMASALPVITTDKCVAGLEMVKDGVNGYLVKSGCEVALREAMERALTENLMELSAGALKTARRYTIKRMAERHLEILEKH